MKAVGLIGVAVLVSVTACSEATDTQTSEDTSVGTVAETVESPLNPTTTATSKGEGGEVKPVPVRVGLDGPDLDACGGYGVVTGLNPQGDNFLSVRSAPDANAEELDRLSQGSGVSMCDYADGWVGIVYQPQGDEEIDCETGSPVPQAGTYAGSCRAGWVSERFVELIAG